MKRLVDLAISIPLAVITLPIQLAVAVVVRLTSKGPALYWSSRVGRNNDLFDMAKFRSMRTETPDVATHMLEEPTSWLTPVGSFLRRTSLDELPQIWHVVAGQMSLVGPRPALFNQDDLIELRTQQSVHLLQPGITGLAQITGRDELSIPEKVALDARYAREQSLLVDLKLLAKTVLPVLGQRSISN